MSAARALGDRERRLISEIYNGDTTQKAIDVLKKLHTAIGRTDWPKLSVVQRELKEIREADTAPVEYWSLGTLGKEPIDKEALRRILSVSEMLRWSLPGKYEDEHIITVGLAKWIARLSPYVDTINDKLLFIVSMVYMGREIGATLARVPVDTIDLDVKLFPKLDVEFFKEQFTLRMKPDSPLFKILKDGAK